MEAWHMSGAGNDFIVIDARKGCPDMREMAVRLCSEYGADGFMALDNSDIADIKLHFYNSDGSRAEMCGNGARCICRFAYDNGITGEKMRIETDAGIVHGKRISENSYRVRLNDPADVTLDKKSGVDYAKVGVPHATVRVDSLDWNKRDELFERAKALRNDSIFEDGANVNFYCRVDEKSVKILTYERGVEDFTLACGTGSGAVATILCKRGELCGDCVTVRNRGGDLTVTVDMDGDEIAAVYLEGDATVLNKVKY